MYIRLHPRIFGSLLLAVSVWSVGAGCSSSEPNGSSAGGGPAASAGDGGAAGGGDGGEGGRDGSGGRDDGDDGDDGDGGRDGGTTQTPGTHFATTSTSWPLPAGAPGKYGFDEIASSYWNTMDLDGDGKPDLVVTAGASESNRQWLLYKNTGSGFATTSTSWTLPAGAPGRYGFDEIANSYWTTMDLDGDGKPDLVVNEGASESNRRWQVYKNTGSGFATTSTSWTLPAGAPGTYGFDRIANSYWTTMDLDGDGKPDLVVNEGASESNRRWQVYKNTGSGFATTSTSWTLPAGAPGTYGFDRIANSYWRTMDLDGDGKPDLVVNEGASESNRQWRLYKNTGSGFATTSTSWPLPAGAPGTYGFDEIANSYWNTMDLDGDRKPDLVVTAGASESNRQWLLYKNTGSGFATTSTSWTLPAGAPGTYGFDEIANSYWNTMDLDGDGKPDLVVTAGASESNRQWLLYKNTP